MVLLCLSFLALLHERSRAGFPAVRAGGRAKGGRAQRRTGVWPFHKAPAQPGLRAAFESAGRSLSQSVSGVLRPPAHLSTPL